MTLIELARKLRPIIEQAAAGLDDSTALEAVELSPVWANLVSEGRTVTQGFRFSHEGVLYKTMQPEYSFTGVYVPGTAGTESLFSHIDVSHAGTQDEPIPYEGNMALEAGKYYSQDGAVYLCTRDTVNPVYSALADLVGLYVEKA